MYKVLFSVLRLAAYLQSEPFPPLIARPMIIEEPVDIKQLEGDTAQLTCAVTGEPLPDIRWELIDHVLTNSSRVVITGQSSGHSTLVIHNVVLVDAGNYVCTATNEHGNVSASAELQIQGMKHYIQASISHTHSGDFKKSLIVSLPSPPDNTGRST